MKKLSRQQTIFWGLMTGILAWVISVFAIAIFQMPTLHATRQSIDDSRVASALLTEQQNNITSLESQLKALAGEQERLDKEIWKFTDEESFFTRWDTFGQTQKISVEVPNVADVVPGDDPVARSAELLFTGTMSAVLKAIDAVQSIQPLVAIQSVTLQPSDGSGQVQALLTVSTIWQ